MTTSAVIEAIVIRKVCPVSRASRTDFGPCPRVEVRFFSRFELSWSAVPDKASVATVVGASWDVDVCRVGVWRPI
jgi:hypothetical protein